MSQTGWPVVSRPGCVCSVHDWRRKRSIVCRLWIYNVSAAVLRRDRPVQRNVDRHGSRVHWTRFRRRVSSCSVFESDRCSRCARSDAGSLLLLRHSCPPSACTHHSQRLHTRQSPVCHVSCTISAARIAVRRSAGTFWQSFSGHTGFRVLCDVSAFDILSAVLAGEGSIRLTVGRALCGRRLLAVDDCNSGSWCSVSGRNPWAGLRLGACSANLHPPLAWRGLNSDDTPVDIVFRDHPIFASVLFLRSSTLAVPSPTRST